MKSTFSGILMALALIMMIVIGVVALAEGPGSETPDIPEAPATETTADSTALQDAFKAYSEAKTSSYQESLEAELKAFVEAGKLTQEQADLILNYYKEQQALRDGVCPNCGYQFQNSQGRNGRMNGGFGGKGSRNNGMFGGKGGRGMMGQIPSGNQDNGSANGTSFMPGSESLPAMTGTI